MGQLFPGDTYPIGMFVSSGTYSVGVDELMRGTRSLPRASPGMVGAVDLQGTLLGKPLQARVLPLEGGEFVARLVAWSSDHGGWIPLEDAVDGWERQLMEPSNSFAMVGPEEWLTNALITLAQGGTVTAPVLGSSSILGSVSLRGTKTKVLSNYTVVGLHRGTGEVFSATVEAFDHRSAFKAAAKLDGVSDSVVLYGAIEGGHDVVSPADVDLGRDIVDGVCIVEIKE